MSLQSLCFAISRRNLCLSLRYSLGQFKLIFKIRERRLDPRVHLRGLLLARIPTREFSRAVNNFKRHGSRWGRLQVIGDDCAARGILTLGDLGRQGSPFKRRRADAKGRPWPEQVFAGGSNARG